MRKVDNPPPRAAAWLYLTLTIGGFVVAAGEIFIVIDNLRNAAAPVMTLPAGVIKGINYPTTWPAPDRSAGYRWKALLSGLMVLGMSALGLRNLAYYRRVRRRAARPQPVCDNCDYSLHGLTTNRCPECGTPVNRPADAGSSGRP
jgi:hypothetical protein